MTGLESDKPTYPSQANRRDFLKRTGVGLASLLIPSLFRPTGSLAAGADQTPDFNIFVPSAYEGRFYTQTRGLAAYPKGFSVLDDKDARMWQAFRQFGEVGVWGYPASTRWHDEAGKVCQAFQKGIFQLTTDKKGNTLNVEWMNTLDILEQRRYTLDKSPEFIPNSFDWSSDRDKVWSHNRSGGLPGSIEESHIERTLSGYDQGYTELKRVYFSNPYWFEQFGLPTGIKNYGSLVVLRCQKTALQYWSDLTPWTKKPGEVVTINVSEIAKNYGLIPDQATQPVDPPAAQQISVNNISGEIVVRRGDAQKPFVYLTIDDLWNPTLATSFLKLADAKGIKVILFPIGNRMATAPAVFREAVAQGHSIENHTQNHSRLSDLSSQGIRSEISQQLETVRAILGDSSYQQHFMRPPGGAGIFNYDPRIPEISQELNLKVAMWTADSNGWRINPRTDSEAQQYVMQSIRSGLGQGSIVLQHAIGSDAAVFEQLINEVLARKLQPVTMAYGLS